MAEKYLADVNEKLTSVSEVSELRKIINQISHDLEVGNIKLIDLRTNNIFDTLTNLVNSDRLDSCLDTLQDGISLLSLRIREIHNMILQSDNEESMMRYLHRVHNDLELTRQLADHWIYPLTLPGLSEQWVFDSFDRLIKRKKKKDPIEIEEVEDVDMQDFNLTFTLNKETLQVRALDYFTRVREFFPITVEELIAKSTSLLTLTIEEEIDLLEKRNRKIFQVKENEPSSEEKASKEKSVELASPTSPEIPNKHSSEPTGIECFSFILKLLQEGKIALDPNTDELILNE